MKCVDVSIVVVSYQAKSWTLRCVESILANKGACCTEVVVVDNASTDGTVDELEYRFPQVEVIANRRNVGYSRAGNQGRRRAEGRHIVTLDNDALMLSGTVDTLCDYLDDHPEVGMVGPRLLNPDLSDQGTGRTFPTALHGVFGRNSLATRLAPHNRVSRSYLVSANYAGAQPFAVDWLSTACVMTRAVVAHEIEMDESFFVYWVDADWCRQIKAAGWQIMCVPDARAIHDEHRGRGRTGKRSTRSIVDFHRGAYRYYRKHHIRSVYDPMNAVAVAGLSARAAFMVSQNALRRG
jgi:GT2 family glycosyltransferase